MERFFETLSGRSRSSSSSTSSSKKTKNKEILLASDLDTSLNNWQLPPIASDLIYKSTFKYKSDYVIKTVEQATPVHGDLQSLNLLSEELIQKHQEKYLFLHIGMIQVAVKPATRLGLNTAAILCVRDKRHLKFNDSLLGVVESSLCDGPIFFQCYPNLTLSLRDPHILQTLILDIKTMGYDMLPGSENLILIYRIHYKAMNSVLPNLREKATKLISLKGTTTLFVTNMSKGNLIIPKSIQWDQVTVPPKKEESTAVQSIVQTNEGAVAISFARSRSFASGQSYAGASLLSEPIPPRSSVSTPLVRSNSVIRVQRSEEQVAKPVYEKPQSPTPSNMGYDNESVLSRSFKIMMLEKEETPFEKWFSMQVPKREQKLWQKKYEVYKYQKEGSKDFPEFLHHCFTLLKIPFPNFNDTSFLATLESNYKSFTNSQGKILRDVHPPLTDLTCQLTENSKVECNRC